MLKTYSRYLNKCFCAIYIIFYLISALKCSCFKENMIISMSFRRIHVLEYVKAFIENFF